MANWLCMNMVENIGNLSIFNRILFWFVTLGSLYPYPVWGSPYQSADHHWPMYNITNGTVEDVQGAAHTIVHNGATIIKVPQLGHALSLDGKDDWVDTGGFNADCVTEPSTCKQGFTLTFWLKVYSTGYVMSSGSLTNHRNGPGYQLYYHQSLKRFKFLLETRDKRWTLLIHEEIGLWTHMAFTWHNQNGLRYYEDGNLSTFTDKPEFVSPLRQQNYTPVITLARPNRLLKYKEFGKFEISQFAIWLKELSAEDIAGVYKEGVVFDPESVFCCFRKSVSPCFKNPCHDAEQCLKARESDSYKCICPRVSQQLKTCKEKITGECEDKSTGCRDFAAQTHYCKHRKMRAICPRSCSFCAPQSPSTTVQPTLSTGSTSMSRLIRESKDPVTTPPTPTTYRTTHRRMPRGPSCEVLQCRYHAQCIETKSGDAECRCGHECHSERRPVCGTNGKTYLNMCELRLEACKLGEWIDRKHHDFCSEKFKLADHYLPMNGTTADNKLIDMRGNASAQAHNGVQMVTTEQLGEALNLDGKDNFIELQDVKSRCIVDPTDCKEGLSVAFWIKYDGGEFIISSGGYAISNNGPGFRFICQNCPKKEEPHAQSSETFLLELSTSVAHWKILLDSIPRWWFHFAFTWSRHHGLKFYENGKLIVSHNKPVESSKRYSRVPSQLTIGKPNSLQSMLRGSFGAFSIGHLVIWMYELKSFDVEVAFLTVQTKSTKSMVCCGAMKADPCIKNPCHDGATCHRMEDKYQCICTDINYNKCPNEQKLPGPCIDQTPQCFALAKQDGFCDRRRKRMKKICPKACNFCASQKREISTTSSVQIIPKPKPSPGSQNMQTPLSSREVPTTAVVGKLVDGGGKQGMSQGLLILSICAGSAGVLLLLIVLAFILTRFYKQRKGEFVPDKSYPNCHDKENGEASMDDVETISTFIDPSTPRITDVPHKATKAQATGGGVAGAVRKSKKPMGVKVTYKPPEWD